MRPFHFGDAEPEDRDDTPPDPVEEPPVEALLETEEAATECEAAANALTESAVAPSVVAMTILPPRPYILGMNPMQNYDRMKCTKCAARVKEKRA